MQMQSVHTFLSAWIVFVKPHFLHFLVHSFGSTGLLTRLNLCVSHNTDSINQIILLLGTVIDLEQACDLTQCFCRNHWERNLLLSQRLPNISIKDIQSCWCLSLLSYGWGQPAQNKTIIEKRKVKRPRKYVLILPS